MKACHSVLLAAAMLLAATTGGAAGADTGVLASIKPVHSLVAGVMRGVGEPALIVDGAASPHAYALKPSQARALQASRAVFWIGPQMEVFLEKPLKTLAANAAITELMKTPGLTQVKVREGGPFEAEEEEADADHAEENAAPDSHDKADAFNPHVWLDPKNAKVLVAAIAQALGEADPANAARYAANAEALTVRLDDLASEIDAQIAPVKDKPYIVFHDAYQHFEARFGLSAAGSITVNPDVIPGAARVAEIRQKIKQLGATCVFSEPQFEPALVSVVLEGTNARSGVLDPLGATIPNGPDLYFTLMRDMAKSLHDCLSRDGMKEP